MLTTAHAMSLWIQRSFWEKSRSHLHHLTLPFHNDAATPDPLLWQASLNSPNYALWHQINDPVLDQIPSQLARHYRRFAQEYWCIENVGTMHREWAYHYAGKWYFRDADDAVLFILTWV